MKYPFLLIFCLLLTSPVLADLTIINMTAQSGNESIYTAVQNTFYLTFSSENCFDEYTWKAMSSPNNKTYWAPHPSTPDFSNLIASQYCAGTKINLVTFAGYKAEGNATNTTQQEEKAEIIHSECDVAGNCRLTLDVSAGLMGGKATTISPTLYMSLPVHMWESVSDANAAYLKDISNKETVIANMRAQLSHQHTEAEHFQTIKKERNDLLLQLNVSRANEVFMLNKTLTDRLDYGAMRYSEGYESSRADITFYRNLLFVLLVILPASVFIIMQLIKGRF